MHSYHYTKLLIALSIIIETKLACRRLVNRLSARWQRHSPIEDHNASGPPKPMAEDASWANPPITYHLLYHVSPGEYPNLANTRGHRDSSLRPVTSILALALHWRGQPHPQMRMEWRRTWTPKWTCFHFAALWSEEATSYLEATDGWQRRVGYLRGLEWVDRCQFFFIIKVPYRGWVGEVTAQGQ